MKKALFALALVMVAALLLSGCGNSADYEGEVPLNDDAASENAPETYVDEQIVDENEEVEIGEMI